MRYKEVRENIGNKDLDHVPHFRTASFHGMSLMRPKLSDRGAGDGVIATRARCPCSLRGASDSSGSIPLTMPLTGAPSKQNRLSTLRTSLPRRAKHFGLRPSSGAETASDYLPQSDLAA